MLLVHLNVILSVFGYYALFDPCDVWLDCVCGCIETVRMSECLDLLLFFLRCLDEGDLACRYVVQNKLIFVSFCV